MTDTKTLHFDLNFTPQCTIPVPPKVSVRGVKHDLVEHDDKSLAKAAMENKAIALILKKTPQALTHYANIPTTCLPDDSLSMLVVEEPRDPDDPKKVSGLYSLSYYIPDQHIRHYFENKAKAIEERCCDDNNQLIKQLSNMVHSKSHYYGIDAEFKNSKEFIEFNVAHNAYVSYVDIAVGLLFRHPQLTTNRVSTATRIMLDHILQIANPDKTQLNLVNDFATQISTMGCPPHSGAWASVETAKDENGQVVKAEYDLKGKDGKAIFTNGQTFYNYEINPDLDTYIGRLANTSLTSSRRDPKLQNKHWSVAQGKGAISKNLGLVHNATPELAANNDASGGYTLIDKSPGNGLFVDPGSIKYTRGSTDVFGTFVIEATNSWLRQLGAYIEFYSDDEMTKVIKNPSAGTTKWPSYFDQALADDFETDTKKVVGFLPNIDTIMGIPLESDPIVLTINWPEEAQAAKLYFGGIGTSNSIQPIIWPGVILTSVFQFAIPTFFVVLGTALTTTAFFKNTLGKKVFKILLFQLALPIIQAIVSRGIAGDAGKILGSFGTLLLSLFSKAAFLPIALAIAAQTAAGEAEDAIPILGLGFRIANIAITAINLAETTGEVIASPAVYEVDIKRHMTLTLRLQPDPNAGEPGHPSTAIWPLVGDHVETIVTYTNGSTFKQRQKLPPTSSNAPLIFTFADIGWGGKLKVTSNVFSKNGWLCGKFESSELDAIPENQSGPPYVMSLSGHITEFLVPLTQDTQYVYHQKLGYDSSTKEHVWIVGTPPTATIKDLNCGPGAGNLCDPVDITINQKGFQIGYAFGAGGQNIPSESEPISSSDQMYVFQNISALAGATLSQRLKFSKMGFDTTPYILYDTYGQGPDENTISPYNFIVDSRNDNYFLRQVDLTDGTHDFGLTAGNLKSYGKFTLSNLDAIVFHHSGYVIGASFKYSKVQILKINLNAGPVDDSNAPAALTLSGPGMLEGLMLGPISMKVTPDGRILVLETLNRRIQAFDAAGNPVPSFPGKTNFTVSSSLFSGELDAKTFSSALQKAFQQHGLNDLFMIPNPAPSLISSLNSQTLTMELIKAFAAEDVFLTYNQDQHGNIDPTGSTYISVQTSGSLWTMTDPEKNNTYTIENASGSLKVFDVLNHVSVSVIGTGQKWVVNDLAGARAFLLELDPTNSANIEVKDYRTYVWLGQKSRTDAPPAWLQELLDDRFTSQIGEFIYYNLDPNITQSEAEEIIAKALTPPLDPSNLPYQSSTTYLDIAVEAKGYMYVLYFTGDGSKNTDYFLDIYDPDGRYLVTSPDPRLYKDPADVQHVSAARMTLDKWRNLFTLNFETFAGPVNQQGLPGRTEPSISTWTPTPPMITLDITDLPIFQTLDLTKISPLLAAHLKLTPAATIKGVEPKDSKGEYGHFLITDGANQYDIIVSLSYGKTIDKPPANATQKIFVYNILA